MSGMMVLGWLFFSIAAGMFAHIRCNRNGIGWFAVAFLAPIVALLISLPIVPFLFLSPIVAFVLLAILPMKEIEPPADETGHPGWKALRAGVADIAHNDNEVDPAAAAEIAAKAAKTVRAEQRSAIYAVTFLFAVMFVMIGVAAALR